MRHLSENFVKVLLADEGAGQTSEWLSRKLMGLGLPPLQPDQFDEIRQSFRPPRFFNPRDPTSRESVRFLRQEAIHGYFYPDKAMQEALDILHDQLLRDRLETVLLGRHEPADAARLVNKALGCRVSHAAVALYKHYFFDVSKMSTEDLAQTLYASQAWKTSEWSMKKAAIWGGKEVSAYRAGVIRRLESREILERMKAGLYAMWLETERMPHSLEKVQCAQAIVSSTILVDERMSSSDTAVQEVLAKFQQFRMHQQAADVPSLTDLSRGLYSKSGKEIPPPIFYDQKELEDAKPKLLTGGKDELG